MCDKQQYCMIRCVELSHRLLHTKKHKHKLKLWNTEFTIHDELSTASAVVSVVKFGLNIIQFELLFGRQIEHVLPFGWSYISNK